MRTCYNLPAPAKVNLFLHVVGRRSDGYHLLQSAFVLLDWSDTLHFEARGDTILRRHDLGARLPDDDLCLRAARLLQQRSGTTQGVDILIDKQLPWGAGIGGGSSNAATTLLALNRLWNLHWPRERLAELALQLGADVPFFIGGRNAWVEGIGERLTPLEWPPRPARHTQPADEASANHSPKQQWLALLKPDIEIPTQAIFSHPDLVRDTKPATVADFLAAPLGFGRNDLQAPAEAFASTASEDAPDGRGNGVTQALKLLGDRFGNSRMTGSGSAVFAHAGNGTEPPAQMLQPHELPAGWVGRMCRVFDRHPLLEWVD